MLKNGPFCKFDVRSAPLLRRKSGCVTPSRPSWCIDRDHKKEVVSVRVMREVSHRLVIFLSGTRKKMLETGPFCNFDVRSAPLLKQKSGCVTPSRPSRCIDRDHKKEVVCVRAMRKVLHRLFIFLSGTINKC